MEEIPKLNSRELDLLDKIIANTIVISHVYQKLYQLEINNCINSDEYKKQLRNLRIAIEEEIYLYKKISHNQVPAFAKHIITEKMPKKFISNVSSIALADYWDQDERRILNILRHNLRANPEPIIVNDNSLKKIIIINLESIQNYIANYYRLKEEEEKKRLMEGQQLNIPLKVVATGPFEEEEKEKPLDPLLKNSIKFQNIFEKDFYNTLLVFLNGCISNSKLRRIKNDLIRSKYNILFTSNITEASLIEKGFVIPQISTLESQMTAEKEEIEYKHFINYQITYYQTLINQIQEDVLIGNAKTYLTRTLCNTILRASLVSIPPHIAAKKEEEIKDYFKSDLYELAFPNNNANEKVIYSAYADLEEDRKKIRILSTYE